MEFTLNENWSFRNSNDSLFLNASVPGCVHTDLLANERIADPYFEDNEQHLQWIEKTNWEYHSYFFADAEILNNDKIELVFKGLDTYADVYLNDSLILSSDNMFREWVIACKEYLRIGKNELFIKFWSPVVMDSIKASRLPYQLPDTRGFSRKAPYQYGWDWGPRFVTSGIWQPIYLRYWNEFRIDNIQVIQKELNDEYASISAIFEIESTQNRTISLVVLDKESNTELAQLEKEIKVGFNWLSVEFKIDNPKLWWTNGLGKAHLYDWKFIAKSKNSIDKIDQKIGLRTLKLVQNPDSIGSSFLFELNGIPVFMKGANYIPQDNFPSRVTDEKYKQTIQTAIDANMNMLRVWGGGIYEKDIFYDLCDEKGILVWQDFMFACNMYPGDKEFIENIEQEAIQHVKRLRNHPCIALWCGNNEISEGWYNWGWQKSLGYSEEDSLDVWNAYLNIFENILPGVITDYDLHRSYWPSSPSTGWGHEQALFDGDMHYWGVWWGEEPFEVYEQKVGRFMSEYGFQGFPDMRTLDSCLLPENLNLNSKALLNHQKHPRGMELIQIYMERDFKVPTSFKDYAYVSQLVQAFGIQKALEAHRRAMPYCMGTLYWQLNDCWPVISWSSVDYYNHWKALHYFTKKTFKEYLISFEESDGMLNVFVASDNLEPVKADLKLEIMNFTGENNKTEINTIEVLANSSKIYMELPTEEIKAEEHLVSASLIVEEKLRASKIHYLLPVKKLKLPDPNIKKEISKVEQGYQITLKTDKLAKNIFLSVEDDGHFSDNYFDLLPGEEKQVIYFSNKPNSSFEKNLKIISLVDTF